MKTNTIAKKNYESPVIKVVKIQVERGFATSSGSGSYHQGNEPIQNTTYMYTLDKVNNRGRAW